MQSVFFQATGVARETENKEQQVASLTSLMKADKALYSPDKKNDVIRKILARQQYLIDIKCEDITSTMADEAV